MLNTIGWLYHELGDPDTARIWDVRALEALRGTHAARVTEAERYTLLNLASDELASGRVDAAAEHLRAFEPLLARREYGLARYPIATSSYWPRSPWLRAMPRRRCARRRTCRAWRPRTICRRTSPSASC